MSDELSRAVRLRESGGTGLVELVSGEVDRIGSQGRRDAAAFAWIAWNEVNGDVERAHTTGVYVGEPRRGARDPELTVYVDSAAYLTDFSANREIYLARLETAGLRFADPGSSERKPSRLGGRTARDPSRRSWTPPSGARWASCAQIFPSRSGTASLGP